MQDRAGEPPADRRLCDVGSSHERHDGFTQGREFDCSNYVMLGFKRFRRAATTISGIELMHRIRKGQFDLATLGLEDTAAAAVWNAVLFSR